MLDHLHVIRLQTAAAAASFNWLIKNRRDHRMLLLLLLSSAALSLADPCPRGGDYNELTDECISFSTTPLSFVQAARDCVSKGGSLSKIGSAFENVYIAGLAPHMLTTDDFWVGSSWHQGEWMWADWTALTYTHWAPGQPGAADGNHSCMAMQVHGGKWQAQDCGSAKPYVCVSPAFNPNATVTCPTLPTTPMPTPTPYKPKCDQYWEYYAPTDSCYRAHWEDVRAFSVAESLCANVSAHLASIHSQAESNFINGMILNNYMWTSISYSVVDDEWHNTDNTPVDYGWNPISAPTNDVSFYVRQNKDRREWVAVSRDDSNTYVCKKAANY